MLARAGTNAFSGKHRGTVVGVREGMTGTTIDPRITWAVKQMQRRLHEPIGMAELAGSVNLSPSRFRHLFRAQAGVGPLEFLRALRMRRARLLIERTFLAVKEVMSLVGYNDPSHFSRDFRRVHGTSATELRARGITTPRAREPGSSLNPPTDSRIVQRTAGRALVRSA
jgi:transcriptional regulator GlxA family with amidase domain